MAIDVYLKSFRDGQPGGGDAMGALSLIRAFGADLDDFGAWQVALGDGVAAEVNGLPDLDEAYPEEAWALSCVVRLSDLTPRGADFLFGLAQSGLMAIIVPHTEAPGGAYVLLPIEVDPEDLPDDALFDDPKEIETSDALFAALAPIGTGHWSVQEGELTPAPTGRIGLFGWLMALFRGR